MLVYKVDTTSLHSRKKTHIREGEKKVCVCDQLKKAKEMDGI